MNLKLVQIGLHRKGRTSRKSQQTGGWSLSLEPGRGWGRRWVDPGSWLVAVPGTKVRVRGRALEWEEPRPLRPGPNVSSSELGAHTQNSANRDDSRDATGRELCTASPPKILCCVGRLSLLLRRTNTRLHPPVQFVEPFWFPSNRLCVLSV